MEATELTSWLHNERLAAVLEVVRRGGERSLLDLGCGDGDFLVRVAQSEGIDRVVGVDLCDELLARARARLGDRPRESGIDVQLLCHSIIESGPDLSGFDCAVLIETIEHIEPGRLSALESTVFLRMQPRTVAVTTPNAEFNPLLGVPPHRFRHPDHRFEWDRRTFGRWADGVAERCGYEVECRDIAGAHPVHGGASQMAVFRRRDSRSQPAAQ